MLGNDIAREYGGKETHLCDGIEVSVWVRWLPLARQPWQTPSPLYADWGWDLVCTLTKSTFELDTGIYFILSTVLIVFRITSQASQHVLVTEWFGTCLASSYSFL